MFLEKNITRPYKSVERESPLDKIKENVLF